MKILIVSPYLPHPRSGHGTGDVMHGLLRHISRRHEITLISFCDKRELALAADLKELPIRFHAVPRRKGVQENVWSNLSLVATRLLQFCRSLVLWQPYYMGKYYHPRMARLIKRLTAGSSYDIVQLDMVQMGQYFRYAGGCKRILYAYEVAFRPAYRRYRSAASILARSLSFIRWCQCALFERRMAGKFDRILCVTDQDKTLLERLTSSRRMSYLPLGADVSGQPPPYASRERESLVFVGSFSHRPNREAVLWLVGEIFPLVLNKFPGATLSVIGSNPPDELKELAARTPQVRILGFVDDVAGYLRTSAVFIAPLRSGGGVKVKILHAMGQGIPVVTTKVGIEGITPEGALVGNTAGRLADNICALFGDRDRAAEVGRKGWEAMRAWNSWESVTLRLEGIYEQVLAS